MTCPRHPNLDGPSWCQDCHGRPVGYDAVGKYQRPGDAAETQRVAAVAAYPLTGTWRAKVLEQIEQAGERGCTDEEIQHALGMNPSTQRPRRVELVEGCWIMDSGRRRKTRSGREAVVWVLYETPEEPEPDLMQLTLESEGPPT